MIKTASGSEKTAEIFVVATPIGNLSDMSPRAIRTLQEVDFIAAEDTRTAKSLLSHFGISRKEVLSYFDSKEKQQAEKMIQRLMEKKETMALISEAGTPAISDPGYRLVAKAHEQQIRVTPIPGPSALTSIISASGLPSDRFLFVGFLPNKTGECQAEMHSWRDVRATIVFYESARRLEKKLDLLLEIYPTAQVCIGRELTKMFEEILNLPVAQAKEWVSSLKTLKGEVSVAVSLNLRGPNSPAEADIEQIRNHAKAAFRNGESLKSLLQKFKERGLSRGELYQLLLSAKDDKLK